VVLSDTSRVQLDAICSVLVPHLSRARQLNGLLEAVGEALVETLEQAPLLVEGRRD